MKNFLLLVVSFSVLSFAHAQDSFISKITLSDSEQNGYLTKVIPLDTYCIFFEESEDTVGSFSQIYDQSFQFYKTSSNDTLFLFDGKLCPGHESGVVNVCKFTNGKPRTLISQGGKVAGIQDDEIWVYTYPCCAEVLNIITPFSLKTGEKIGDSHLFYSRNDFGTIFPIQDNPNQKYSLAKDTEIRWSPSETDESYTPVCGSLANIIDTLFQGTDFTLIEVSSNDWVLIRLDNMITSEGYCIRKYNEKLIGGETYALYGWVPIDAIKWE